MTGRSHDALRKDVESRVPYDGGPDWSMTFADTMSLLMGFFVLLLSFSSLDRERFVDVSGQVQSTFGGPSPTPPSLASPPVPSAATGNRPLARPARETLAGLEGSVEAWRIRTEGRVPVRVFQSYRGVEVTLPADRVFEPGMDRPSEGAQGLVAVVAGQLETAGLGRKLLVEVPCEVEAPRMPQYEDPWALAMGRAQALSHLVHATVHGPPDRIVASAAGPSTGSAAQVTFLFENPEVRPR